jgi:hypothetical protein
MAEISKPQLDLSSPGVMANERMTSLTGGLLLVLLALMGVTVLSVRTLLPLHFLLGFLVIPPLALKWQPPAIASCGTTRVIPSTAALGHRNCLCGSWRRSLSRRLWSYLQRGSSCGSSGCASEACGRYG